MNNRTDALLQSRDVDTVLITDPYNMRYISGFCGGEGILYISKTQHVLITDSRYTEEAMQESDFTVAEENQKQKRTDILKGCLERDQPQRVGYEDMTMRCSEFAQLSAALPVKEWVPMGSSVNDLRQIKTPEELDCLRKAEAIGDTAFTAILDYLRPGVTELQAAARLEYEMKMAGASGTSFETIMASGLHSSMPHARPSEKKLEKGDFVTMDFGCVYHGYCSDMTRTVVIGTANAWQREVYEVVQKAQEAALSVIRSGLTGKEVDKVARDIITEAGYGDCFGHGLGHSVGLFIHEEPRLSPREDHVLLENMIETVEPGIYVPGFGGVRIEDMVIVTKEGHENLAHSPKQLIEL
ncbi:MAG: aminopeptidase P family protein [Lachnospiraceae bacterium]|nr:aminopeptidase P family protein [Lachnospiraceae bacterium]